MKKTNNQSGFAHLMIVVIILAVALVGTLGFVFWQNFMQPKTNSAKSDSSKVDDKSKATPNTVGGSDNSATTTDTNKGYLVLDDWGVKFKLPVGLGSDQVTYYKVNLDNYAFSTKNVEALGGACVAPGDNGYVQYPAHMFRTTVEDKSIASAPTLAGKFDDYYYYYQGAQAPCSDGVAGSPSTVIENKAYSNVRDLLMSVVPK